MAPIRYSLHYEDYSEHLMSRFGKLLQMQSLVDMTLMCSSHTLRVHKAVLAASSAYFQEVLQKQTGEPLIILKMRFSVLKSLVEFMYCGKTQCLEENLDELVSAAQFLKIKGLAKVTKEGLGITNNTELPAFTPPVVINRPPQSLIDLHTQENPEPQLPPTQFSATNVGQSMPVDNMGRSNKGGVNPTSMEYAEPARTIKPRRGRPSQRTGWETTGPLSRAAERALMRREQDSRKAIHQLKHLQTRYNQDYMDRVTLSQAVSSICGPETPSNSYMNMDTDFMYMDQSSSVLDPYKEPTLGEPMAASYSTPSTSTGEPPINTAMSQYVNALKSAGLPTDLPILFESGDGSYINVNEQVLLDMVQSSEIQYEVIEQPNIIENVANPAEIKSIDDLSKSIERGEMMINKDYPSTSYDKDSQYSRHEDAINSLNAILPDNLDSYGEQQNYVVLDPRMQESNNAMDHVNTDFSCIDGDMQFFTKSMSDDVKKYYVGQQLDEARVMEMCPTTSSLDTTFNMSLLESKNSLDSGNMSQQFSSLNSEDLRRNEDCYDFGLQLSQSADDALDCLINKQNEKDRLYSDNMENADKARDEIIKDLMSIETNMTQNVENNHAQNEITDNVTDDNNGPTFANDSLGNVFEGENNETEPQTNKAKDISTAITTGVMQWDNIDLTNRDNMPVDYDGQNDVSHFDPPELEYNNQSPVIDLTKSMEMKDGKWDVGNEDDVIGNKENFPGNSKEDNVDSTLEDDIPFAVGLLPLKQIQPTDDNSLLKRKNLDTDIMDHDDAKCLKRKVKYKI